MFLSLGYRESILNVLDWLFVLFLLYLGSIELSEKQEIVITDILNGKQSYILINLLAVVMQMNRGIEQSLLTLVGHEIGHYHVDGA